MSHAGEGEGLENERKTSFAPVNFCFNWASEFLAQAPSYLAGLLGRNKTWSAMNWLLQKANVERSHDRYLPLEEAPRDTDVQGHDFLR